MQEGNIDSVNGRRSSGSSKAHSDPMSILKVLERLEVGPVRVEKRRLVAPYRAFGGGKESSIELVCRYEEDVFEPTEKASRNLACMIAAQVALNCGLFCGEMVFHGSYDGVDRGFLRDMAENTAREIFVNKFLMPNPFLTGEAARMPAVKKESYIAARLEFPDAPDREGNAPWELWPISRDHYALLSSGGKDSLLSFGLLDEISGHVNPIFINESGRHWFTALNAYRHFKRGVPSTARVWINSDRVFAWFLRLLPFVRRDFGRIRSDEYPIRLWTIAVFVFGALPIVRKRRIGRLVIGDEYDSTQRTMHRGIPHYNALYDQSRYFDNALSRYYLRKGWMVSQFSVLRPLSELLIEKTLVERYPELQEHQVSCHAAHIDGDRVRPCGKCEKCRRIVGMLSALGADPKRCGYTDGQAEDCLADIAEKGVHQESPAFHHLLFMLLERKLIEPSETGTRLAAEHPEVLKLRFDTKRSPIKGIPRDIRRPLFSLLLRHADGAVRREERRWKQFDPLADPEMKRPYSFELASEKRMRSPSPARESPIRTYLWSELTWPEAEKRLDAVDIALLPVGSLEQHGPHLPLDTDAFDSDHLARCIAESCSEPKPLVLPLIAYGISYEHSEFKGTISISNDTLSRLVYEIGMSAAGNGINKLVIINGHGGNNPALNYAAQMITRDAKIFVCVDTGETSDVDVLEIAETPNDIHAGEIETSTTLAVRPHLVRRDRISKLIPVFSSRYLEFSSKRVVQYYTYTKRISKSGVIGDPTKASVQKGQMIWRVMIAHLVALVEDLKGMTLEEIYQKRY